MRVRNARLAWAFGCAALLNVPLLGAQGGPPPKAGGDTADAHIALARQAAGREYMGMFNTLCVEALAKVGKPQPPATPTPGVRPAPPRSAWHAEPVKAFDNLYWVGQTEFSSWAITTSQGIIEMDAIFDYAVRDEVVEGLRKLGLNPADIKYVVVSHAHGDHIGGAKALQDMFGAHVVMSAADWELAYRDGVRASSAATQPRPRKDIVATDGMPLTLGDETITIYFTPGHTPGTISTIIPLKDRGTPHVAAYSGGTMFNWLTQREQFITPTTDDKYWFDTYAKSADHFREIAEKAGADVVLSNHTEYDGSKEKQPLLATRKAGDPNPYVVGKDSVRRYLTVVGECAKAGSLMVSGMKPSNQ